MTQKLELNDVPGFEGQTIVLRTLDMDEYLDLLDRGVVADIGSRGQQSFKVKLGTYQKYLLAYALDSAPFLANTREINSKLLAMKQNLNAKSFSHLFAEAQKLNDISFDDKKKS